MRTILIQIITSKLCSRHDLSQNLEINIYITIVDVSNLESAVLKLPSGQSKPLPYLLTLVPPLILSLLDPEIFFKALDFAGTYGGKPNSSSSN